MANKHIVGHEYSNVANERCRQLRGTIYQNDTSTCLCWNKFSLKKWQQSPHV